jgi:hypothetical protein
MVTGELNFSVSYQCIYSFYFQQQNSNDPYSFTLTNDVGSVAQALLGTAAVQSQACTTGKLFVSTTT